MNYLSLCICDCFQRVAYLNGLHRVVKKSKRRGLPRSPSMQWLQQSVSLTLETDLKNYNQEKEIQCLVRFTKLHTNCLIELRAFWASKPWMEGGNQWSVCPLPYSLRNFHSHQDLYMTKKAHKCTVSVREGCPFSPLEALPLSKFASQSHCARGQSLDRGGPVRGKSNESLFTVRLVDRGPAYLQVLSFF